MGDENIQTSPRRLRNHSYKDSIAVNNIKMSGKMPEVEEEENPLITKEDFAKKSTQQKLDTVADAINKMYEKMAQVTKNLEEKILPMETTLFDGNEGTVAKIDHLIQSRRESDQAIQSIMEENLQLRDELDVLKGIVHKLSNQLDITNSKVHQLVAKSMEDNLVFTGILGDAPKSNPRKQLHDFLLNEMGLYDVRDSDLLSVYRMGQPGKNKNRPIVAHCVPELRRYIMNNAPILKNRKNQADGKYYINPQLPEAISEHRREIRQIIKEQKDKEQTLPRGSKSTFVVRNDKLFINGQLKRKKISVPQIQQLFPNEDEQKEISSIKMRFFHTQPEKGSQFKAAILKTNSFDVLHKAYIKLFQKYPTADHIAAAAILQDEEAYNDNGEFGSGYRILRCMKQAKVHNTVVFMIRFFGGVHLGPRRFSIMTDLVSAALEKVSEQPSPNGTQPSPPRSPILELQKQRLNSTSTTTSEEDQIQEETEDVTVQQE